MATKCNHEDSRLTCSECSAPICSNCLVQCPVGFRCQSCTGTVINPVAAKASQNIWKAAGLSIFVGFAGGILMQFIQVPLIACILCYIMGAFAGRGMARLVDCRMSKKIENAIIIGLLFGLCFTPVGLLPFMLFELIKASVTSSPNLIFDTLITAVSALFCPVLFVLGVLRSTIWSSPW